MPNIICFPIPLPPTICELLPDNTAFARTLNHRHNSSPPTSSSIGMIENLGCAAAMKSSFKSLRWWERRISVLTVMRIWLLDTFSGQGRVDGEE
jgi:hypothetical protein